MNSTRTRWPHILCSTLLGIAVFGWNVHGEAIDQASAQEVDEADLDAGLEFNLHVFTPKGNQSLPVIFFVGGFGGNVPVGLYSDVLKRIAARGFVVVGAGKLRFPSYIKEGKYFSEVLEWARAGNLQAAMAKKNLMTVPDVEGRAAVMGQSAGNHVVGEALVNNCSVAKAWVMVDPVDGADPYRIITSEDLITPGKKLSFTIPGLILDNALDTQVAVFGAPACDPYALGTSRFFPAMRGPVWNINATAFGHTDCLNDNTAPIDKWVCKANSSADRNAYRGMLADKTATFLEALFQQEPDKFKALEDPEILGGAITLASDLKGLSHQQIKPGCTNQLESDLFIFT